MNFTQELKAIVHAKQHLIKPGVCFGTTRTGQPCKRPACNGEQYCPVHSAHGLRRRRLKRITDMAAPDLFELWCAADREMLLKEHGGHQVKPALLVLQVLEQLGKQIRLVDCPPKLERQVRDAIGGVEVEGRMVDAGLVQIGTGTLAQIAEEAAMILGFLRREVPMRLQKGEPWDDKWEWQARGFALVFLLPAGPVLADWALCRDVTQMAAAWHVTGGFMVERLRELGALV